MSIFSRRLTDVTLLTQDENTILSKIRYPDLPGSVLYGHLKFPNSRVKPYKLVLGIASVARPPGVDYLTKVSHIYLYYLVSGTFSTETTYIHK